MGAKCHSAHDQGGRTIKNIDDLIVRVFTKELEEDPEKSVYDLFDWDRDASVRMLNYRTGETLYEADGLEFPAHYSQNARDIIASRYFRKRGVPGRGSEHSMRQVADRMAGFWKDALIDEGLILSEEKAQIFYDELVYALLAQMWAPNSPQWFNTGIKRNYGIAGDPDDLYYYDEEQGKPVRAADRYTRSQSSACFILSITDQLMGDTGITSHYVNETKLFKGGSGVGTNFSALRADGERLSGGGCSSGLMSFLEGLDRNAGAIKSGGTTRRAAKMVIVDYDHPEIEDFIRWKAKEEEKARALAKMGYDASLDGEAYHTVGGQNANNSVRVDKAFMDGVKAAREGKDSEYELKGRTDSSVNRKVKYGDIWKEIVESAWLCADPALQFDDLYNQWHTCPAGADGKEGAKHNRINATNPCSEYAFIDDTACNLASVNLYRFYDPGTGEFDADGFVHLCSLIQMVLEASIHMGQFPTPEVAENSWIYRTTGLGLANYASLFLALGLPYDSDEARALAGALTGLMTGASYAASALMAERLGAFPAYYRNAIPMGRVIRNHARAAGALGGEYEGLTYKPYEVDRELLGEMGFSNLSEGLDEVWKEAADLGEAYGYRNAQVSVIAPTGTISFAMDCGATSIEPFYSHVVFKTLIGGGSMEIVNPVLPEALRALGYSEGEVRDILDYMLEKDQDGNLLHYGLSGAPHIKDEHLAVFDAAGDISPEGHVLMVAAVTPLISGSVSKTVNLPGDAMPEDIADVYILAHDTGVKAISIYRDGSKMMQPLSTGAQVKEGTGSLEDISYSELLALARDLLEEREKAPKAEGVKASRRKPFGVREAHTHSAKIGDVELYITAGVYPEGGMSEIFVSTDRDGTVVKGLLASLSKAISHMLQYGISPEDIAQMLRDQNFEPSGPVQRHPYIKFASSISDLISKVIDMESGDFTRIQVKPEEVAESPEWVKNSKKEAGAEKSGIPMSDGSELEGRRVYDKICAECGSDQIVQAGHCLYCKRCGATSGCS